MSLGQRGDQLLVQKRPRHQTGTLQRRASHPQIDLAGHQSFDLHCGDHLAQVELHVRQPVTGPLQQPWQHGVCGGRSEADDDGAEVACGDALDGLGGSLGQLQDAPCVGQERRARRGQRDRARGAVDQLHTELALELLDLPAQRWLRHVQALGGAAEVQLFGDGDEARQPGEREHQVFGVSLIAASPSLSTASANSATVGTRPSRNFSPIDRCARLAP